MTFPIRPRRSVAALGLSVLLAACGTTSAPTPLPDVSGSATPTARPSASGATSPSPSATPMDPEALYTEIEGQVRDIRGLEEKTPVEPKVIGEDELVQLLEQEFERDNPPEYLAGQSRMMQHLGLLPPGADLQAMLLELLGSQVLGQYDQNTKELYVISREGGIGAVQEITYAHEYDHALQDQNFDLDPMLDVGLDQSDKGIARLALVEGDATFLMVRWGQANMTAAELGEVAGAGSDPETQAILDKMPRIVQETLQFPYNAGLAFVGAAQLRGGWPAVDAMYAQLPDSTEQILHPDKYLAKEAVIPVTFPKDLATRLGGTWKETIQDTFGEFQTDVWLVDVGGATAATAMDAAGGWGGDRVVLIEDASGAWAVVLDTAWDTDADQAAFVQAAQGVARKLTTASSFADVFQRDATSATVIVASSRDAQAKVANVLGLAG